MSRRSEARAEQERLSTELVTTARLLETVLDAIPDVIGIQDLDHGIVRYNAAGYRFLNATPEEVRGRKCFELIGQDRPCDECATSRVYETGQPARDGGPGGSLTAQQLQQRHIERLAAKPVTFTDVDGDAGGFSLQLHAILRRNNRRLP